MTFYVMNTFGIHLIRSNLHSEILGILTVLKGLNNIQLELKISSMSLECYL